MLDNFYSDLAIGKQGEEIVLDVLTALRKDINFISVGDDKQYWYCGDIAAVDTKENKIYFIEVKNDSRIADTGNILCEDEVYYKGYDYYGRGNMQSDSDIFAIVSQAENKIYFIDFKILKANYRLGEYKEIEHKQQITYCYLLPIGTIKKLGGLLGVVNYEHIDIAA